ncbi:MAG: hypothetical protein U9Q82_02015 [Chloroflexota bacterium]|nr:hypothetical protein [Chloroflexota bacterium]
MISISLDDSDVPTYLIDFIMYHELLHKKIGQKIINGRIYSHTSEFRAAESEFHHYEKAETALNDLARKLA